MYSILILPLSLFTTQSERDRSRSDETPRAASPRSAGRHERDGVRLDRLVVTLILLDLSVSFNTDPCPSTDCLFTPCLKLLLLQALGQGPIQLPVHGPGWRPLATRPLSSLLVCRPRPILQILEGLHPPLENINDPQALQNLSYSLGNLLMALGAT